ncbi:MAG: PmoA family protein [Verrucomicrobiae bacterium]|nr:PmoA family protein [Verrucomicrobiae bacterium]
MLRMLILGGSLAACLLPAAGQVDLPSARPVPALQALPLPLEQISFEYQGRELTRYYYSANLQRPFLYPLNGPAGRSLTRMGHPRDPQSHKHHNSVWISHQNVQGANFWEDFATNQIVHVAMERLEDGEDAAYMVALNEWRSGGAPLLRERRQITVRYLNRGEWLLLLDMRFEPVAKPVTLGQTAFGFVGVRMAKTVGVRDGGGLMRNSEGGVNEAGCFRKPARWVDYSGAITATAREGVTLMDHPANYSHPTPFHVRDDGWMGASPTFLGERVISAENPLELRYGLYVHDGIPTAADIEKVYALFVKMPRPDLRAKGR